MEYYADLHLHSRFARATSKSLTLPLLVAEAEKKGISLLGIPDYTHPEWLCEVEKQIVQDESGFYTLKKEARVGKCPQKVNTKLVFCTELSMMFRRNERGYRVHLLVIAPDLGSVKEITKALSPLGKLSSDGRPIFGKDVILIVKTLFSVCPEAIMIPAHIWTPWFSLFGSRSGFDRFDEAFGEYSDKIPAVETGLSSDPSNSWRVADLDEKNIVSFSDAHSLSTLGRELTLFKGDFNFAGFRAALFDNPISPLSAGSKIESTIEFYPEEGKYHYSGHRKCNVVQSPQETQKYGGICPVCGKKLTLGVLHRIDELSSRSISDLRLETKDNRVKSRTFPHRPPFLKLVPLLEVIAQANNVKSKHATSVIRDYELLINEFGNELDVLLYTPVEEIENAVSKNVAVAIAKNRVGEIVIAPGFDGEYGKIVIDIPGNKSKKSSKPSIKTDNMADVPAQSKLL